MIVYAKDLYEYLYKPYELMSGNGQQKDMKEVEKLPIRKSNYEQNGGNE